MQVSKWGHSLAVRLLRAIAGTRRFEIARDRSREQALARLRKYRNRLPAGFKFDRETAHARRAAGTLMLR